MLRLSVLLLVLANAGYYAWSHGMLAAYGFAPIAQAEPQRMAQQIKPEALRILTPLEVQQIDTGAPPATAAPVSASTSPSTSTLASTPTASASSAVECLQVGIFNEEQTVVLKERLGQALPAGSWVLESALEPGRWMVYMGKYNNADAVTKKRGELRGLGVSFETLNNPALEPGLSLGRFDSQAAADADLVRIAKKGVKTAKVIQERAEQRGQRLKLAAVDAALRGQLDAIKPQLAGKTLQTCR
jgi:hypothetical protein